MVTSDPDVSQITKRIKLYKGLMGDDYPVLEEYCGVLAGPIYQLTVGAGGVPGTFATYLDDYHDKWLNIYHNYQLSRGEYINLYDIGFDYPEAHVIKKDGSYFYAFYTHPWTQLGLPRQRWWRFKTEFDFTLDGQEHVEFEFPTENYTGEVNLRGLDKKLKYRVFDYASNIELGIIKGNKPYLRVSFNDYLLLELRPEK
jgi:alpha-galactosidase